MATKPVSGGGSDEILDFSDVRPFEPLDSRGLFRVRITNLEKGVSQVGQPKTHCEMTILEPEEVAVEVWEPDDSAEGGMVLTGVSEIKTKAEGRKLFREFSHQAKALPFLHQLLKALDPDLDLSGPFAYDPAKFLGLEATVKIRNEAFEEQIRPRVQNIYPASRYHI